jgi:hypothetical protein
MILTKRHCTVTVLAGAESVLISKERIQNEVNGQGLIVKVSYSTIREVASNDNS